MHCRPLLHSYRDGAAFFDHMQLPLEFRAYAGRTSVTAAELCDLQLVGTRTLCRRHLHVMNNEMQLLVALL